MNLLSWRNVGRVYMHKLPPRLVQLSRPSGHRFITLVVRKNGATLKLPICAFLRQEHSLAAKKAPESTASADGFSSFSDSNTNDDITLPRFDSLEGSISDGTLKAITGKPFNLTHMTPVQAEVLPLLPALAEPYDPENLRDGEHRPPRDILVRAKTGTGKTIAFLVPAIEARIKSIEAHVKQAVADSGLGPSRSLEERAKKSFTRQYVGTLILSPTRELATQIATEASRLCSHHPGMDVRLLTGGSDKRRQMRDWRSCRRDIVVATPGRLQDLLESEPDVKNGLSKTQLLVLDETDSLLDIGFRDDIDAIKRYLPSTPERQTFLFSATVSRNIRQIARESLDSNHLFINTVDDNAPPVHAHIPQYHTVLPTARHQIPHILQLLAHDQLTSPTTSKTIVFLPTTKMTQLFSSLLHRLSRTTLPAGSRTKVYEIHSKKDQSFRTRVSEAFRRDRSGAAILVSSDVSARGVDYPGVTRVIQVGIPGSTDQYVHRIGRTGRAGTGGRGDLVLLPWEMNFVRWHLTEMPLQPLTVGDLSNQVQTLATRYDTDPKSFSQHESQITSGPGSRTAQPQFLSPLADVIKDTEKTVADALLNVEEQSVAEAFTSLLGYYIPKNTELRAERSAILQGCKDWAVEACGLPVPPYVSEQFIQRLGVTDRSSKRTGKGGYDRSRQTNAWEGRGNQRSKRSSSSWLSETDNDRSGWRSNNSTRYRDSFEDESKPRMSSSFQRSPRQPFHHRRRDDDDFSSSRRGTGNRGSGERDRRSRYTEEFS